MATKLNDLQLLTDYGMSQKPFVSGHLYLETNGCYWPFADGGILQTARNAFYG